jgi:hypothetical protein
MNILKVYEQSSPVAIVRSNYLAKNNEKRNTDRRCLKHAYNPPQKFLLISYIEKLCSFSSVLIVFTCVLSNLYKNSLKSGTSF